MHVSQLTDIAKHIKQTTSCAASQSQDDLLFFFTYCLIPSLNPIFSAQSSLAHQSPVNITPTCYCEAIPPRQHPAFHMASEKHSHACYHDQDCAYVANYKGALILLTWHRQLANEAELRYMHLLSIMESGSSCKDFCLSGCYRL